MTPAVAPGELAARFNTIRLALTAVGRALQSREMEFDDVLAAGPAGADAGRRAAAGALARLGRRAEIGPGERIAAYAIVAPTERNFHPAGLFFAARRLSGLVEARVAFDVAPQEPARA